VNLVDQHPLVKAVDAKLADLQRRRADFEARVAPLAVEDAEAEAEYNKAVDVALLEGGPVPLRPVRQIPEGRDVDLRHGFIYEQQLLTEERRRAVAAAYDDVLHEARSQATKLLRSTRPTVEKLTVVMAKVSELLQAVQICRTAANAENPRQRHDARLTVETFIRLALTGGDPTSILDLADAPPRSSLDVTQSRNGMLLADIQRLIGSGQDVRA
jgi:hypothetical protein